MHAYKRQWSVLSSIAALQLFLLHLQLVTSVARDRIDGDVALNAFLLLLAARDEGGVGGIVEVDALLIA